jgi:NAD-dependent dihydropyrimidine dehydrogenase PreA subunit
VRVAVIVIALCLIEQFLAREHAARICHQLAQQFELNCHQLERRRAPRSFTPGNVQSQVTHLQDLRGFGRTWLGAAQYGLDARHQLADAERLDDVIVRTQFQPDDAVNLFVFGREHDDGQVVPIEDVDKILDMTDSVVRLPCVCRSLTTGRSESRYCYGLGVDPTGLLGQFPDYGENLEWLTREDARTALHALDKEGLVHSVWTFDTPFIAGLCNCDQDCMAYRMQVGAGTMQVFFAAEYVASVDWERCSGCKLCRGQCPFGAIRYTATQDKCLVDPVLCYGCGICRATCKKNAIKLEPRRRAFRWQRRAATPGKHKMQVQPCQNPRECRACVDVCPSRVFGLAPRQQFIHSLDKSLLSRCQVLS